MIIIKKVLIPSSAIYGTILLTSIIFMFNNFTLSAETNFVYRIVSMIMLCYFCSLPLLIATSKILHIRMINKILLYILYILLASLVLLLMFKMFGDKNFLFNSQLTAEAFKNSQENLTSMLWIISLITCVGNLIFVSLKLYFRWKDWTFLFGLPLMPLLASLALLILAFYVLKFIFKGISFVFSLFTPNDSNYDNSNYSYENDTIDETEDEEEQVKQRYGILRSPGENYYDGNGILRSPGENYYDANGILRTPDENYYDYNGILRSPGENYYDANGVLRTPDENYYDGGN